MYTSDEGGVYRGCGRSIHGMRAVYTWDEGGLYRG